MILLKMKKKKLIFILNIINLIFDKKSIDKKSENLFLIKKKNKIYLSITDNIILIKKKIKTKINSKKKISINFPIKNFIKIIKSLPECIINIIYKKKKIFIKKKNINYNFKIKNEKNNYINKYKKNKKFKIKKKLLFELIDSAYFIISKNTNKSNSLLSIKKKYIEITSMDNYRLILDKIIIEDNIKYKKNIIIPNKTLKILYKILKIEKNEKILIIFNKFQIKFKFKNLEIISKIIDNNYPILNKKIKKEYKNNFIINKKELQSSLKRSNIITEKENFSKWKIYKNILKIITNWNSNKGEEIININYSGKNINIGVNNNHMLELISNIKSENLNFNFSKKNKNIIILNPEKKNFKYITTTIKI
ncbi:DNA polymerase III beta subunit [Candidatus Nasuia deltocephalinicola]|nr:DNA polymerase III beta subunit [Candidatus Nasuia deltocephalinicola]